MTASNLAVCFAPSLFHLCRNSRCQTSSPKRSRKLVPLSHGQIPGKHLSQLDVLVYGRLRSSAVDCNGQVNAVARVQAYSLDHAPFPRHSRSKGPARTTSRPGVSYANDHRLQPTIHRW